MNKTLFIYQYDQTMPAKLAIGTNKFRVKCKKAYHTPKGENARVSRTTVKSSLIRSVQFTNM